MSEASGMSFVQRFRYNTIVARYHVMRDLWRRTMQQREGGAGQPGRPAPPEGAAQEQASAAAREREITVSISDPERDEAKIRRLYDTILQMRQGQAASSPNISYQQFVRYISDQTQKIQGKFGCASVQFAISIEEDAIRFTARAAEEG